jgi:hypothetical protein
LGYLSQTVKTSIFEKIRLPKEIDVEARFAVDSKKGVAVDRNLKFTCEANPYPLEILSRPKISLYLLIGENGWIHKGIIRAIAESKLFNPGIFLGPRLMYDLSKNEVSHIDLDDVNADWYQAAYQVIIYPAGLKLMPHSFSSSLPMGHLTSRNCLKSTLR